MLISNIYVFYKIFKGLSPWYLTKYVDLKSTSNYQTRSTNKTIYNFFVREWNELNDKIRDAESMDQYKSMLMYFVSLNQRSLFSIHHPVGVKLLTRLRLKFSHLNEHKFCHTFRDCVTPVSDSGAETETISHFFLLCQYLANERRKLWDDVYRIDDSIKNLNEESLIDALLHVSDRLNNSKNKQILFHTLCYIQTTKRFERPLIDQC